MFELCDIVYIAYCTKEHYMTIDLIKRILVKGYNTYQVNIKCDYQTFAKRVSVWIDFKNNLKIN